MDYGLAIVGAYYRAVLASIESLEGGAYTEAFINFAFTRAVFKSQEDFYEFTKKLESLIKEYNVVVVDGDTAKDFKAASEGTKVHGHSSDGYHRSKDAVTRFLNSMNEAEIDELRAFSSLNNDIADPWCSEDNNIQW